MSRRNFLTRMVTVGMGLGMVRALTPATAQADQCAQEGVDLRAESTYFKRIRHHHELVVPLAFLANPPAEGYKARTSQPIASKTDAQLAKEGLGQHSHPFVLTQEQLKTLAAGKEVYLDLLTPTKELGHRFVLCATNATLEALARS